MLDKTKFNVYGIKLEERIKLTGRDLDYVGTWDIGYGVPSAVFADRRLKPGSKLFLIITMSSTGEEILENRDWEEMATARTVTGIRCVQCQEIIYSVAHGYSARCKCDLNMIEGGPKRPTTTIGSKLVDIDMLAKFRKNRDET